MKKCLLYVTALVFISACVTHVADEPGVHPDIGKRGWSRLFNGNDLTGFMNTNGNTYDGKKEALGRGKRVLWAAEDGVLARKGKGGGCIWTQKRFEDFILDLELNTKGNSGIFFRCDKPKDCVQTGIELQVEREGGPGKRAGFGAIYDCLPPSEKVGGEGWHHVTLTCRDNLISVVIDEKHVIDMDLNKWTTPNKNPDGSKNKFRTAMKDFKREGHIGFQEHGADVKYRNIMIKELKSQ